MIRSRHRSHTGTASTRPSKRPRRRKNSRLPVVGTPPQSYGHVEDYSLCRRVYIQTNSDMKVGTLKCAAVSAFPGGDAYSPDEITVVMVGLEGSRELSRISHIQRLISYHDDFEILGEAAPKDEACIIVSSVYSDYPSTLNVIPLAWPVSTKRLYESTRIEDLSLEHRLPSNGTDADYIERMCQQDGSLFVPVPAPVHRDDWAAKVREPAQSVQELAASHGRSARNLPGVGRKCLCILPLVENPNNSKNTAGAAALPTGLLLEYCKAFFDTELINLLPALELIPGTKKSQMGKLSNLGKVGWRNVCKANGIEESMPAGQYDAGDILDLIHKKYGRRKGVLRVLGVTMCDLFSGEDDAFTMGLANMRTAGVFSFYRYHPDHDGLHLADGWSPIRKEAVLVSRMCKTAVHEVLHLFNIGHCVYRRCLMNGSGHLREDFSIPHHLCPCCLAKLKWIFGDAMELHRRSHGLLKFYRENAGFENEALWMEKAISCVTPARSPANVEQASKHL